MADELTVLSSMDQMEMYRFLTEQGGNLPALEESERTDENFVQGCVSNVYVSHGVQDGRIRYRGSSDSLIVRGYLAILIEALSGLTLDDVLEQSRVLVEEFAEKTNIRATLTPNRANAFGNIYQLMYDKAEGAKKTA
ncbi:SufE family protein [Spirochaeta lutea]|uniref:SufE family protein n=1 Tax=Spirochaeta lutea TaxID=1480694 RepID=UPI000A858DAE|nr:SufE family protein [Spirochaeta lutea]